MINENTEDRVEISFCEGNRGEAVKKTLDFLIESEDFFRMEDGLVKVSRNNIYIMEQDTLMNELDARVQYVILGEKRKKVNTPADVIRGVLAADLEMGLKPLKGRIDTPVLTSEDRLVSTTGYDAQTQLYLFNGKESFLPDRVSREEALSALESFMYPFKDFPFETPSDRSVCLAAALTAISRPVLDTAPAFAFDAPRQGTGKTYLARCIALLSHLEEPMVFPPVDSRNDDETRKRIYAFLASNNRVIFWDNVVGAFNSPSVAALLTSEKFADRLLGHSKIKPLINKSLFLITGNNLQISGDLTRRIFICRLNSNLSNPTTRVIKFSPVCYIKENHDDLIRFGLILIRGYLQSEECKAGGVKADRLASFEGWDALVRQVVAWVALSHPDYVDPKKDMDMRIDSDPEQEMLSEFYQALRVYFKDRAFTASDLLDIATKTCTKPIIREYLEEKSIGTRGLKTLSIGKILASRRDQIVDGLRLVRSQQGKKAATYRIELVNP